MNPQGQQPPSYPQFPTQATITFPYPTQQATAYAPFSQPYFTHQHPAASAHIQQQQQQQPQQQQPQTAQHVGDAPSPNPSSPDNGPGAPPPEPDSPSMLQYEQDLADELRRSAQHVEDLSGHQPEGESGEPVFHLPPPLEGTYANDKDLERSMHAWSLEHGYELVRRASKKNAKGVLYKRYYHCSKHGKLANTGKLTDESRVRVNRKSNRIGCPMSLAVVAVDPANPDGEWQIRHRKTHHNHGPLDALALAGHRRRARVGGVELAVDGLFAIGTPTAQVLQFLQRTNPNGLFTRTDVANMKLKWKKYGTCVDRRESTAVDNGASSARQGGPSACGNCRGKKVKCDRQRPTCTHCLQSGTRCEYDHDHVETHTISQPEPDTTTIMDTNEDQHHHQQQQQQQPAQIQPQMTAQLTAVTTATPAQRSAIRAEEILANLQTFQTEHIKPTKLTLQSSQVDILAHSSCGNGDSYRIVPSLQSPGDWPRYRDAMIEAAMKENTYDVLMGNKREPIQPDDDCKVDDWNEYIRQLAIFNRRNTALAAALWGSLAEKYRSRVQHLSQAAEIWTLLEDTFLPHGTTDAFALYLELHSITQQNSTDLKDYIIRLESAYNAFNQLGNTSKVVESTSATGRRPTMTSQPIQTSQDASVFAPSTRRAHAARSVPHSSINVPHPGSHFTTSQPIFSEEMLCFLFLKNLGPEYRRWTEGTCATNNIGGFGTGPRVGFVELTRRATQWDLQQRRGL